MDTLEIWLALAILVVTIVAVVLLAQRRGHFVAFGALASFLAGMIVVYVIEVIQGYAALVTWYGVADTAYTIILAALGVAFVYAGYCSKRAVRMALRIPAAVPYVSLNALYGVTMVAIIVGIAAYVPLVATSGSMSEWLAVSRGGTDWEAASSIAKGLTRLLEAGVLLQLLVVYSGHRQPVAPVAAWVIFATVLAWNFYLGTRSGVILLVVGGIAAFYIPKRRNPPVVALLVLFVVLYAAVTFQEKFRTEFYGLRLNVDQYSADELFEAISPLARQGATRDDGAIQKGAEISCAVATVSLVPDVVDYNMGYPFLELVTRWVPRSVWPDKSYPLYEAITPIFLEADLSSTWIPYAAKPVLAGPALTFVGHWYAMGGLIAVVLAAYLTGMMLRLIDSLYLDPRHGFGGAVLFIMLSVIGFSEAAATPTTWIFSIPFALIPVYGMLRFAKRGMAARRPAMAGR